MCELEIQIGASLAIVEVEYTIDFGIDGPELADAWPTHLDGAHLTRQQGDIVTAIAGQDWLDTAAYADMIENGNA